MIKVLFLIHDLGKGGAERVLLNLVNGLDKSVFDITVISIFGDGVYAEDLDPCIRYKSIFKRSIPGNSHIMKLFSPSLLHSLFIRDTYDMEIAFLEGVDARIISGCRNRNTVLLSWIHIQQKTPKVASYSFRNFKEAVRCYNRFDHISFVSKKSMEDFCSVFPKLPPVSVIPNVQDDTKIWNLAKEKCTEVPFTNKAFRIIGIGKQVKKKGFIKLLEVHKRLLDDGFQVQTILLGDGVEAPRLHSFVENNALTDSVWMPGFVKNPYPYLAESDLFVCASEAEGYSTATAESIVLQIPVVTTPVAGAEELAGSYSELAITDDYSVEALYAKIKNLVKNQQIYLSYKSDIIEQSKQFSKNSQIRRNEEFLLDMVNLIKEIKKK